MGIFTLNNNYKGTIMKKTLFTFALIPVLLSGCVLGSKSYTDAPPTLGVMYSKYAYLGYYGDPLPIEKVGIITTDGLLKIKTVDDIPMGNFTVYSKNGFYSGGRYQLHLKPGTHTLTMGFHDDRGSGRISWSKVDVTKIVTVNQGQVLHLMKVEKGWSSWDVVEADGKKDIAVVINDFKELSTQK